MTAILVRLARDDADIEAARKLCREWLDWHWENYPSDWPTKADPDWLTGVEHPMDREKFQAILEDLPERHKRPGGGILVASVNGNPAGCGLCCMDRPTAGIDAVCTLQDVVNAAQV